MEKFEPENFEELADYVKDKFSGKKFSKEDFDQEVWDIIQIDKRFCNDIYNQGKEFENDNRFFNKIFGEVYPLKVLSDHVSPTLVSLADDDDPENNQIDAILEIQGSQQNVECVLVIDGHQRALSRLYIKEHDDGLIPRKIETNERTKSSGEQKTLKAKKCAVEVKGKNEFKKELKEALKKKIFKENPAYNGAWLVIVFRRNEFIYFKDQEIEEICVDTISELKENQFQKIYLIGIDIDSDNYRDKSFFYCCDTAGKD